MKDQDFIEIIETNKERIFRICRLYSIDPVEPEDLFQEVVYQVWKSLSSFKGESHISSWIYRIALNVSYRSNLRAKKSLEKMTKLDSLQIEPVHEDHEEEVEVRYEALQECLRQLNKADQSIMVLFLEEVSYKEIAEIIGITENYVAVKMKRIRALLFDCITPKLESYE